MKSLKIILRVCSDECAYKIIDWMYECLKDYMK